jgi:hypothetical protein
MPWGSSQRRRWAVVAAGFALAGVVALVAAVAVLRERPPHAPQLVSTGPAARASFAVLGDFGVCRRANGETGTPDDQAPECEAMRRVRDLVASLEPDDGVLTVGDNTYDFARTDGYAVDNRGFYEPVIGSRFYPTIGNHDWLSDAAGGQDGVPGVYLPFFRSWVDLERFTVSLAAAPNPLGMASGSEGRYYHFVAGGGPPGGVPLLHLFALDSDDSEPHGREVGSRQYQWLAHEMRYSNACFQVAYFHEPPYTSGSGHTPEPAMAWDFERLGVDLVLSGHQHQFEVIEKGTVTYVVNGLGGATNVTAFRPADGDCGPPDPGSAFRYPPVETCAPATDPLGDLGDDRGAVRLRAGRSADGDGRLSIEMHVVSTSPAQDPDPRLVAAFGRRAACFPGRPGTLEPGPAVRLPDAASVSEFHGDG